MSIVTYENATYELIDENKNDDLYFIYSHCQDIKAKEYVVIERINKEKLRNELSKLPLNDLQKTFEEYILSFKKDIELLKNTPNENLLKGIDFINKDDELIIIKPYADTNLRHYVKKEKKRDLSSKEISYIFNQLNNVL